MAATQRLLSCSAASGSSGDSVTDRYLLIADCGSDEVAPR